MLHSNHNSPWGAAAAHKGEQGEPAAGMQDQGYPLLHTAGVADGQPPQQQQSGRDRHGVSHHREVGMPLHPQVSPPSSAALRPSITSLPSPLLPLHPHQQSQQQQQHAGGLMPLWLHGHVDNSEEAARE